MTYQHVNSYESDPSLQGDEQTLGKVIIDTGIDYVSGQPYDPLVSENLQRAEFLFNLQLAGLEKPFENNIDEIASEIVTHIHKTPAQFEKSLQPYKEQAIEYAKSQGLEHEPFTISGFESTDCLITDVDSFYYTHIHRVKYQAELSDEDIIRTITFLKTKCAHDDRYTPIQALDEIGSKQLYPNISDAIGLLQLKNGVVNQQAVDALMVAQMRKNPTFPTSGDRIEDTFRFCAIKAFMTKYEMVNGRKLKIVDGYKGNEKNVAIGFSGNPAVVFEDDLGNWKDYLQVVFEIPNSMCDKNPTIPRNNNPGYPEILLNWNLINGGEKITASLLVAFGMEGIADYQQIIEAGGREAELAKKYLELRVEGLAKNNQLRIKTMAMIDHTDPSLIESLKQASQVYQEHMDKNIVPELPILNDEEKQKLESEAETLLRQYAINQSIISSIGSVNNQISNRINEQDKELKGDYCLTYEMKKYDMPDEIAAKFESMKLPVPIDSFTVNHKIEEKVLNKTKLIAAIKAKDVDPKQFNNVSEGLRIATTKEYKEDYKPEIDRIGTLLVDQIQDLNEHLVKSPKVAPQEEMVRRASFKPD